MSATPATPSSDLRRSPATSPGVGDDAPRTLTSAASSWSARRSLPATSSSARSRPRARPTSPRRRAPAARHIRREGREVRDTSLKVPPGESGIIVGRQGVHPRNRRRDEPRRQSGRPRLYRAEAQDLRRRQDGRPPRQQGRRFPASSRVRICLTCPTAPAGHRAESRWAFRPV